MSWNVSPRLRAHDRAHDQLRESGRATAGVRLLKANDACALSLIGIHGQHCTHPRQQRKVEVIAGRVDGRRLPGTTPRAATGPTDAEGIE
jgi:hypothetical protein